MIGRERATERDAAAAVEKSSQVLEETGVNKKCDFAERAAELKGVEVCRD